QPFEMPPPARRHPPPDQLARHLVAEAVLGVLLGAAEMRVALQTRDGVARERKRLALAVGGVLGDAPPRRLDRPAAVRREDEVDPFRVEPFPELPPRGRAAVAEAQVDRRGDGEDLGRADHASSVANPDYETVRAA